MNILIKLALTWVLLMSASPAFATDCSECDGKINNMIMRFDRDVQGFVEVFTRKGQPLFADTVMPGDTFVISGALNYRDKKSTLGPMISFVVDAIAAGELHTSCSVEIGPGTTTGDFVVIAATSRNGGLTCPVADIPEPPETND